MNEIIGWFPQTNKDTLDMLIKKHDVKTVLEIGTFVGLSAVWFAKRVEHVLTVDPFDAITRINYLRNEYKEVAMKQEETFVENTKGFKNIECLKLTSEEAKKQIGRGFDLVYIDGSHLYEDVANDIAMWYPNAIKILCGDDYTESWNGVRRAVDECGFNVNKDQRCWYIEKV